MSLPALAVRRPVATAMVFLGLIVVGVVSLRSLAVDLLPEIEFTQLTVRTRYPNVGPREIEQIITQPIENAVAGLPDLERVTSRSQEGLSWVRLEFGRRTNVDEAANDLRAALDRLRDELPAEAEPPEILKLDLDRVEVVSLAVTSTRGLDDLRASWSAMSRAGSTRSRAWDRSTCAAASTGASAWTYSATG
jgi:HAE1 family hydrophobic/amphiphilic exporter-1